MRFNKFKPKGSPSATLLVVALSIIALVAVMMRLIDDARASEPLAFSEFIQRVEANEVKSVSVSGSEARGQFVNGKRFETTIVDTPSTWDTLKAHKVRLHINPSGDSIGFMPIIMIVMLLGCIIFIAWIVMRQNKGGGGGNNLFSMGKSRAKLYTPSQIHVSFNDVAGAEEAKESLRDIVALLKNPEKFRRMGAQLPRGILLVGEPGNGKTLLAKALAGEAGCSFLSISGSDFIEVFVGVGASRIRDLFAQARKHAPCIIFIDEIDAVGRHRGSGIGGGHDEREQTLNQLLVEMDGFDTLQAPIIVLAATNMPEVLDKALLRPGRFDRRVTVPYPDTAARKQLLLIATRSMRIDPAVNFERWAEDSAGMSGADIANLANQAAVEASKRGRDTVTEEDFATAYRHQLSSRRTDDAALASGKGVASLFMPVQVKTKFTDVAGIPEAKEELQEVIEFLKNPEKYSRLGARIPRGVMLVGDPGNGKTLLAKAVAGEAGRPFFSVSASSFIEQYVGVGASRIRELYAQARKHAPSIVFIDEIDAIGVHRSASGNGGDREYAQTLNQLLTELDGFSTEPAAVITLASTNRLDILDSALTRPGRFDRQVQVPYPDLASRRELLRVHTRGVVVDQGVDLDKIARGTPGMSGADLANLINEAAIFAAKHEHSAVMLSDFEEARDKVLLGKKMKSVIMSDSEKKETAYHEAGHALVRLLLPEESEPLHKVTIIPRGMALGVTHWLPEREKYSTSREEMLASIASAVGGRAAEDLMFNKLSTGAYSDFKGATQIARKMICDYGMSTKLGLAVYERRSPDGYAPETARLIDEEIKHILEGQYQRALQLLRTHKDKLITLATALLERETLYADEIYPLLGITPRESHRLGVSETVIDSETEVA